jgi:hypothetical protein
MKGECAIGLSQVSDADLESLLGMLRSGDIVAPLTHVALQAHGVAHLVAPMLPYTNLDALGLQAVLETVVAERHHRKTPKLTLVWTGEDPRASHSRHARVFLPQLFERARKHVLVAGYGFDNGGQLFESLHRAMAEHGVSAQFFMDISQLTERLKQAAKQSGRDWGLMSSPLKSLTEPVQRGNAIVALFFQLMWPFPGPRPVVYFDPRTAQQGSLVSLHAKCVVIDCQYTLITSANFTDRGQTRNFEAGVGIEDEAFAASLVRQWHNLVDEGVVVAANL